MYNEFHICVATQKLYNKLSRYLHLSSSEGTWEFEVRCIYISEVNKLSMFVGGSNMEVRWLVIGAFGNGLRNNVWGASYRKKFQMTF